MYDNYSRSQRFQQLIVQQIPRSQDAPNLFKISRFQRFKNCDIPRFTMIYLDSKIVQHIQDPKDFIEIQDVDFPKKTNIGRRCFVRRQPFPIFSFLPSNILRYIQIFRTRCFGGFLYCLAYFVNK